MKILIIDDSLVMRNLHKNILKENDIPEEDFLEADDGKTALSMSQHQHIDMFLVDWNMPHLNGLDFVKKIRATDLYAKSPVIMITSEAAKYNVMEAIEAGVTDYIVKPIKGSVLWDKLNPYFLKMRLQNSAHA